MSSYLLLNQSSNLPSQDNETIDVFVDQCIKVFDLRRKRNRCRGSGCSWCRLLRGLWLQRGCAIRSFLSVVLVEPHRHVFQAGGCGFQPAHVLAIK
jgi:hypothetical protein